MSGFFNSIKDVLAPVAGAVLGSALLPGIGTALGTSLLSPTVGGALGGALGGGLTDGLPGAFTGGVGGVFAGPGLTNALSNLGTGEAVDFAGSVPSTLSSFEGVPDVAGSVFPALSGAEAGVAPLLGDLTGELPLAASGTTGALSSAFPSGDFLGVTPPPSFTPSPTTGVTAPTGGTSAGLNTFLATNPDLGTSTVLSGAGLQGAGMTPEQVLQTLPGGGASAAPSAAAGGTGGVLSDLEGAGGDVLKFLKSNYKTLLPLAIAGYGMGQQSRLADMLTKIPAQQGLSTVAANAAQGQQEALKAAKNLVPTVSTGVLPPGAEQNVANALKDAETSIRSKYANLGLSGSTMEAQELASAQERSEALKFNLANQLTQTGLNALGLTGNAGSLYNQILQVQLSQDKELQDAIAGFASASGQAASTIA